MALREVNSALQTVEDEILTGLDGNERALLRGLLARVCPGEPEWGAIAHEA